MILTEQCNEDADPSASPPRARVAIDQRIAMQTRAAVLHRSGEPLTIQTLELDAPEKGEVLLRMVAAGICGSDRHFVTGEASIRVPVVLGHEGAGVVEKLGPGVRRLRVGDHVLQSAVAYCRQCPECVRGHLTHCRTGFGVRDGSMLDGTFRFHLGNRDVGSGSRLGSFSELTVCPERSCMLIPPETDLSVAAIVACGVTTGMGAVLNVGRMQPGESAAVFGVGGVGMAAVVGAAVAGAAEIVALDVRDERLAQARELGASAIVNVSREDAAEAVRTVTGGGADVALLCIDHVRPEHIATAVRASGPGGRIVLVGLPDAGDRDIPVAPMELIRQQKSILGSYLGGMNPPRDVLKYIGLWRAGRLPLERMVTRRYRLDEVNEAFTDLAAGSYTRGVLQLG
jgi:NDMA-dependent alcohol dehydrogenase